MSIALLGILLGCASALQADTAVYAPYSGHPLEITLFLDDTMTPIEQAYTIVGFDSWALKVPKTDLVVRYGRVDHIIALATKAPEGWVYVVRRDNSADVTVECEKKEAVVGCYNYSKRRISLDMGTDADESKREVLAAHELGHAIGLRHCDEFGIGDVCKRGSIMNHYTSDMHDITTDDIREFCRINGCAKRP